MALGLIMDGGGKGRGGGDSKGRRLYQESVKWSLTRYIKSAPEAPGVTKVTNQTVAGPRQDGREHSQPVQVTVA